MLCCEHKPKGQKAVSQVIKIKQVIKIFLRFSEKKTFNALSSTLSYLNNETFS